MAPGEVVGVDSAPTVIEHARAAARKVGDTRTRFEAVDARRLPFDDDEARQWWGGQWQRRTVESGFHHQVLE